MLFNFAYQITRVVSLKVSLVASNSMHICFSTFEACFLYVEDRNKLTNMTSFFFDKMFLNLIESQINSS